MSARRIRPATISGVSARRGPEVEDAEHDDLVRNVAQHLGVEVRLRRLEREVRRDAALELAQERVAGEAVVDDVRVPEARVQDGVTLDTFERTVDRLDRVLAGRLGARLQVGLVDLDDVRARRLEVAELFVHRLGVAERERRDRRRSGRSAPAASS